MGTKKGEFAMSRRLTASRRDYAAGGALRPIALVAARRRAASVAAGRAPAARSAAPAIDGSVGVAASERWLSEADVEPVPVARTSSKADEPPERDVLSIECSVTSTVEIAAEAFGATDSAVNR